jgi:hypothetical protein
MASSMPKEAPRSGASPRRDQVGGSYVDVGRGVVETMSTGVPILIGWKPFCENIPTIVTSSSTMNEIAECAVMRDRRR